MRRLAAAVAIVLCLSSCTFEEFVFHIAARDAATAAGLRCPDYAGWVKVAGFTDVEARTVHRLMWAESRCNPHVRSRAGAIGLMQIMPMWADDCGGSPADLYDPAFNIRCARHVFLVQGWHAWSTY
jgi:hypothetical protein